MLLTEVTNYIKCNKIYNLKNKNIEFNSIHTNSQNVKKYSIFVFNNTAISKKIYIEEAIEKGAIAILTNRYIKNIKITQFLVKDIDLSLELILKKIQPIAPPNSIAITGTNGKTSVLWYINQICYYNKIPTKSYGTLGYYINNKKKTDSILTTPDYEILYQTSFSKNKNKYNYIFEVSSHALDQNRIKNFPINVAAITNVTHDHLDYHKNFKNYFNTKNKLFTKYLNANGYAILNDNIKNIKNLKKKLSNYNIITYGMLKSDIFIKNYKKGIEINFFKKKYFVNLVKLSKIEIENLTCAITCCVCLKITINNILKIIKKIINPPGRLEKVQNSKYNIYIDYAHTPDALKQLLVSQTFKEKKPHVVFGCGGNRDKEKRVKMGKIANFYADRVYITDDNPRDEDPRKIRTAILSKCKKAKEIADRKMAIITAIKDLKRNEVLIIAGKGHEKIQLINKSKIFFDDLKIAQNEINKKNAKS